MLKLQTVKRTEVPALLRAGVVSRIDLIGASLLQLQDGRILIETESGDCGLVSLPSKLERSNETRRGFRPGWHGTP